MRLPKNIVIFNAVSPLPRSHFLLRDGRLAANKPEDSEKDKGLQMVKNVTTGPQIISYHFPPVCFFPVRDIVNLHNQGSQYQQKAVNGRDEGEGCI